MKNRKKKQRVIAVTLLIVMSCQIFLPALVIASGPFQQEYSTYGGSSDMVNPLTGNFNYSIPLLEVPSPEGNFQIPLTYNSGIRVDQDASWVGLGWSLNVGSINRTVAEFPDDAKNDQKITTSNTTADVIIVNNSGSQQYVKNAIFPKSSAKKYCGALYNNYMPTKSAVNNDLTIMQGATSVVPKEYDNVVSDVHGQVDNTTIAYNIAPNSMAYDSYTVFGPGVAGEIKPFQLENNNIAFPFMVLDPNNGSIKYSFQFKTVDINEAPVKTNFKYVSEAANYYDYNMGTGISGSGNLDESRGASQFGMQLTTNSPSQTNPSWCIVSLLDQHLYNNQLLEADRVNLKSNHLGAGKHIEWYSNQDIRNGIAQSNGFINYSTVDNVHTADRLDCIGGFSITKEDGSTYHYALPIYNFNSTISIQDGNNTTIQDLNKYAVSWLLTGITGADFIDKGTIGILDEQDQGYWVKFDYGRFSSNQVWRFPYPAVGVSDFTVNSDGQQVRSWGSMEKYYLNTISTRSHTAMFIKSVRPDAKGSWDNSTASCALKLDKIVLLKNEDYKKLTSSGSGNLNLFYTNTSNDNALGTGDTYSTVIDGNDIAANANSAAAFIRQNQLKCVELKYDNSLCPGTFNSFELPTSNIKNGKLTLLSVSTYGSSSTSNEIKTQPDYLFEYDSNNPAYGEYQWDAFGMYNPQGSNAASGHAASKYGTEWSLRKITTPIGGTINVDYERDTYLMAPSTIVNYFNNDVTTNIITLPPGADISKLISGSSSITLTAQLKEWTPGSPIAALGTWSYFSSTASVLVTGISGITLTLASSIQNLFGVVQYPQSPSVVYKQMSGNLLFESLAKYGGDVRTAKVSVTDEIGNKNIADYVYTKDGATGGVSSGIISVEPLYIRSDNPKADYNLYDYPTTPVIYGTVNVYTRNNTSGTNFLSRTEYNFETPGKSQPLVDVQTNTVLESGSTPYNPNSNYSGGGKELRKYIKAYHFNVQINTAAIGRPIAIKTYNSQSQLVSKTDYSYNGYDSNIGSPYHFGRFVESNVMVDRSYFFYGPASDNAEHYTRHFRTIKVYNPSILKSITTTTPYGTQVVTNTKFDQLTGAVTESEITNAQGEKIRNVTVPAYTLSAQLPSYTALRSKILGGKNLLSFQAQSTKYNVQANGFAQLLGSTVNLYSNSWLYREYYAPSNNYVNAPQSDVWRNSKSFVLNSPLTTDGTTSTFIDFLWQWPTGNPNGAVNPPVGWLKSSEVMAYDHYSKPLEIVDVNSNATAKKYGYGNQQVIASAPNAKYTEIAYSGAEDDSPDGSSSFFGGEVSGNGVNKRYMGIAHTGSYSCKVPAGGYGFSYNTGIATGNTSVNPGVIRGRTYRASVWVNKANISPSAQPTLAVSTNAVNSQNIQYKTVNQLSTTTKRAGDWYLLSVDILIPITAGADVNLSAYVWNNSGVDFYFDDFRFHPVDAPLQSFVYDNRGLLQATLDQENYATTYQYDNAGRIIATYRETQDGIRKVAEKKYNYARGN